MKWRKSIVVFSAVCLGGLIVSSNWAADYFERTEIAIQDHELLPVKDAVDSLLSRDRDAVRTVEKLKIVDNVSATQAIQPEIQVALDTLRSFLELESLFVMDREGTQLAGSGAVSIGKNYSYRPYFQQAIKGNSYIYPGIGQRLKTQRVFFSAPHFSSLPEKPIGIVGLSVDINKLSSLLNPTEQGTVMGMITEDGVVFASTHSEMVYKSVLPIKETRLEEIRKSLQFGDTNIASFGISLDSRQIVWNGKTYSVMRRKLLDTNIELFSLYPFRREAYLLFVGAVSFLYILFVVVCFLLTQSIWKIKSQQKNLIKANELLLEKHNILLHQATHDPLTNLFNRRAAFEFLAKELARSKRSEEVVAIGMCDIDHFKKVNDTWGHQAGNEVLCHVANTVSEMVREYDVVARIGGEEFLVIAPLRDGKDAAFLFERICSTIAEKRIPTTAGELKVTVSIGVAYSSAESVMDGLISKADQALYRAKAQGRNRVVYADF